MPQSLSKVYLHLVFHIKTISPQIRETDLERVHAYIGQLVNKTGCVNIWVGGIEDHVHALCLLSRNETISHLVGKNVSLIILSVPCPKPVKAREPNKTTLKKSASLNSFLTILTALSGPRVWELDGPRPILYSSRKDCIKVLRIKNLHIYFKHKT